MFDFLFNGGFMFILIIAGIAVFLNFVPLALWISAIAAGVNVGIFIAAITVIVIIFMLQKSSWGYKIRTEGKTELVMVEIEQKNA